MKAWDFRTNGYYELNPSFGSKCMVTRMLFLALAKDVTLQGGIIQVLPFRVELYLRKKRELFIVA